jgi:23S rRNA (pseudouridine1915-N3)-methyltransferase
MKSYCNLQIIELKESPLRANPSAADEQAVKDAEGADILSKIKPSDYVITLEINGNLLTSEELANKINNVFNTNSTITFIIGGSYGLHSKIKERSNYKLSFSKLTFPHQLFRVNLLEQIYRVFKINNNESYHK